MPTRSGFVRPSDPINAVQIASDISTAIGKTVTCEITPTDVLVTGSTISSGDDAAIQAAITASYYKFLQMGAPLVDNPDMSSNRHNMGITEHAAYTADNTVYTLANQKVYSDDTLKVGPFTRYYKTVTTSGGNATYYPTSDATSSGTALFSEIFASSVQTQTSDGTGVYSPGTVTIAGNLKSVVVAYTKQVFSGIVLLSVNLLGSVANSAIPDGVSVRIGMEGK